MSGLLGAAMAGLGQGLEKAAGEYQQYAERRDLLKMEERMREAAGQRAAALKWAEELGREGFQARQGELNRQNRADIAAQRTNTERDIAARRSADLDKRLASQDERYRAELDLMGKRLDAEISHWHDEAGRAAGREERPATKEGQIDYDLKQGYLTPAQAEAERASLRSSRNATLRKEAAAAYRAMKGSYGTGAPGEMEKFIDQYVTRYGGGKIPTPKPESGTRGNPLPLPPEQSQVHAGLWYQTTRGPAEWTGSHFRQ